jgi:hypothetical protein
MSREDWEIFDDLREERKAKRRERLETADDDGWSKHTEHHWYRTVDGHKLDYWPSSNKYQYKNRMYRGAMAKFISSKLMEASNAE